MDQARGGTGADANASLERLADAEPHFRSILHELAGLVDGSSRYVRLARRAIQEGDEQAIDALRMLDGAMRSLDRLAGVVAHRTTPTDPSSATRWLTDAFGSQPVHHAIDAAVEHLAPLAHANDVTVETRVEPDAMSAAPACLYPVLSNGLRNAIEASPHGGLVEITAGAEAAQDDDPVAKDGRDVLVVTVTDRGTSLTTINPENAFVIGYTTKPGGSGVGLPLSRSLIEQEGGTLTLSHDHDAGLTSMVIRLPMRRADEPDALDRSVG